MTIQVGADLLQVHKLDTLVRLLKNDGFGNFNQIQMASFSKRQSGYSLCTFHHNKAFLTGGTLKSRGIGLVEKFDVRNNEWEQYPDLNIGRWSHASCELNKTVYVFGGMDPNFKHTNKIEKLPYEAQ